MENENKDFQESFSVETPKEGDILKVIRTGPKDKYTVEFVNQFGFKVLDVPKGTEVTMGQEQFLVEVCQLLAVGKQKELLITMRE